MAEKNDNEDHNELTISIPMEINPKKLRMTATLEDSVFCIVIRVDGPFSEKQKATARGLCKVINDTYAQTPVVDSVLN